jgi:two-component system, chemotaxis family, CheB/CheR fusion protein
MIANTKTEHDRVLVARKAEYMFRKICALVRAQTGHDFSAYKPHILARRVEWRMAIQHMDRLEAYLRFLQRTPAEVAALFQDLLIGVTNFFRDPQVFSALQEQAIRRILASKPVNDQVRIWVPGCSSGEEAYSIAILLQEQMERLKKNFRVQIYATDIDSRAIEQPRAGFYPASIAADVSPERLARFFTRLVDGSGGRVDAVYQAQGVIRNMLIFSEQDLIKDPPFSGLDLISCRNLLIYMSAELQRKLIPLFHQALNPGGFLLLGTSETTGEYLNLFTALERKSRLYQRYQDNHPGTVGS